MASLRPTTILQRTVVYLQSNVNRRGLKIHPSQPPPNVTLPTKHKLQVLPKVPAEFVNNFVGKVPRGTKEHYRMRGEEMVHTDLILGQFGIIAVHGGAIRTATFDTVRQYLLRKLNKQGDCFAFYRVDPPYKPVTAHGAGKKLGGGKGSVQHYTTPVRAGRVILELGGNVYWEEARPWLKQVSKMFNFDTIVVNKQLLDDINKREQERQLANQNPYTFEWMVRNNIFDCQNFLSPYDQKWFGRFVYKDRSNNKKWSFARPKAYPSKQGKCGY